jgi:hypothetical protein
MQLVKHQQGRFEVSSSSLSSLPLLVASTITSRGLLGIPVDAIAQLGDESELIHNPSVLWSGPGGEINVSRADNLLSTGYLPLKS